LRKKGRLLWLRKQGITFKDGLPRPKNEFALRNRREKSAHERKGRVSLKQTKWGRGVTQEARKGFLHRLDVKTRTL